MGREFMRASGDQLFPELEKVPKMTTPEIEVSGAGTKLGFA